MQQLLLVLRNRVVLAVVATLLGLLFLLTLTSETPGETASARQPVNQKEPDSMQAENNPLSAMNLVSQEVPAEVLERSEKIKVEENKIEVMSLQVFYRAAHPITPPKGSILLMHGQAFSSQNWVDLRTLELMAAAGYHTIAVDLPGYGKTGGNSVSAPLRSQFVTSLLTALKLDRPVIVSPSMSGTYSIPFLMDNPDSVKAYIPVAPVGTVEYSAAQYRRIKVPTLVTAGERDTSLGISSINSLKALPISYIFKVPQAGHACYLDQPDIFHGTVLKFLSVVAG